MLVTKFHRCKTIMSSSPKLSTALMWSRNMMAVGSTVLLLCCFCSIEFEIPHHCWWLWEILLLLTLRNANCRVEFNSRCSTYYISKSTLFKRKPEKKKIFSEMKINLIRSWHKYVIPNSRPFVIQLYNYSVFLKALETASR